jgi:hypothetical protein
MRVIKNLEILIMIEKSYSNLVIIKKTICSKMFYV